MDKKNTVIFFDLDNTMYHYSKFLADVRNKCFDEIISHGINISKEELIEEFPKLRKKAGSNSTKHFDELLKRFNLSKRENHYLLSKILYVFHTEKLKIKKYKFDSVDDILKELIKKGYKIGVITQGLGIKQWDKLLRLDLAKYFNHDDVFITDSLGYDFKRRAFYKEIFEQYKNLGYSDIWMVGDGEKIDIKPSKKIGFSTIRVGTGRHNYDYNQTIADYKISEIGKLFELGLF